MTFKYPPEKEMGGRKKKRAKFTVNITEDDHQELKDLAKKVGWSKSKLARKIMKQGIKAYTEQLAVQGYLARNPNVVQSD